MTVRIQFNNNLTYLFTVLSTIVIKYLLWENTDVGILRSFDYLLFTRINYIMTSFTVIKFNFHSFK